MTEHIQAKSLSPQTMPSFRLALLTFVAMIVVISVGLFYLQTSLHSLMLICILIASVSAWPLCENGFESIRQAMNRGIEQALSAIYIFIMIGVLIAALIQCGAVATLIYYGLNLISPTIFLPASLVLCSLMSLATGTSWGTAGTAGVVMIGIGEMMGIPTAMVAGTVVSGACFGDKISPVSDTTNLAAMSCQTDLYRHIRSLLFTTLPAFVLALISFAGLGCFYGTKAMDGNELDAFLGALSSTFTISPITLLPLLLMLVLAIRKVSAEVAMMLSTLVAVIVAVAVQGADGRNVISALHTGGSFETGITTLDKLFSRGGIESMMWTLSLALLALALGGILQKFGFLAVLVRSILRRIANTASLIATTIVSGVVGNMCMGEAYITIILGGQLFGSAYDEHDLDRSVLSRSMEEGATLSTALIPWTTAGAFFATTLGVSTIHYLPWALFNWLSPVVAIIFACIGIGQLERKTPPARGQEF